MTISQVRPTGVSIPRGPQGLPAVSAGLQWTFDASTADSDQGNGKVWANTADLSAATVISFDNVDRFGNSATTWLDGLDDGGTPGDRGMLRLALRGNEASFVEYRVTGSVVDGTGYRKVSVTHRFGSITSIAEDLQVVAVFTPRGAPGAAGVSGASALTRVRVVATTNVDISTGLAAGQTVDGVSLAENDVSLLTAQTAPEENGVYVSPAAGAASRHTDFDADDDLPGAYFSVMEGTAKADTLWRCTSDRGITLGSDPVVIEEFVSSGVGSIDTNTTYTVGSGGDYANLQAALDSLEGVQIKRGATVTIQILERIEVTGDIAEFSHPYGGRILIEGTAPLDRALAPTGSPVASGIVSVTGSPGAWTVTANLDDATDVEVGDVVVLRNVVPGIRPPGTNPATIAPRGELRMGFFQMGALSSSGTTVSFSGSATLSDYFAVSNLLIVGGEVRRILTVGASTLTIDSAFSINVSGRQYWYYVRNVAVGTVSCSGTTVTGASTQFTNYLNVGDIIVFNGNGYARITAIASDTSLTIARSMTVSAGTLYGVIRSGELHEGAWEVTAVSGTQVTWVNTGQIANAQPPQKEVNGGDVTVLKGVLVTTDGSSGLLLDGSLNIKDIAFIGSGGTSTVGIDLRSAERHRAGCIDASGQVAVIGFGYGVRGRLGSVVQAPNSLNISDCLTRGVDLAEACSGDLEGARVMGTGGIGVFLGVGAHGRLAGALSAGNLLQGYRWENGGSCWGDFSYAVANGSDGYLSVGGSTPHVVGARSMKNGSVGCYGQNGGFGRGTGIACVCNDGAGLNITGGQIEFNQAWAGGNIGNGAVFSETSPALQNAGLSFNTATGLLGVRLAAIDSTDLVHAGNDTAAISMTFGAKALIEGHAGGGTITPTPTTTADGKAIVIS